MTDTDKLELLKEHAQEYYKNGRVFHFVKDGFVQYEVFDTPEGIAIYFAEIFVSKTARGGKTLSDIVDFCKSLEAKHDAKVAYCRVEKGNPHIKALQKMYARVGFGYYKEDDDALYYRWTV